jgi:hypothetical protein
MSETKKYIIITFDGIDGDIYFELFETDIDPETPLFDKIVEYYAENRSSVVLNFEKFREAILDITYPDASLESFAFEKVVKKGEDDFEVIEE